MKFGKNAHSPSRVFRTSLSGRPAALSIDVMSMEGGTGLNPGTFLPPFLLPREFAC